MTQGPTIFGFIADGDNISVAGQRRTVDLFKLVDFLKKNRHLDPAHAVICTNYVKPMERLTLEAFGFELRAAGKNADDLVNCEIERMVEAGVRILTLASGDARAHANLLIKLKAKVGLKVHLIAGRHSLGERLRRLAHGVTYLENFIVPRRPSGLDRSLFPWAMPVAATRNAGVVA